jgi:ribosomal protein S1
VPVRPVLECRIHLVQIGHPREAVKENEEVQVRIISIEPEKRRMGLSIKQAEQLAGTDDVDDDEAPANAKAETGVEAKTEESFAETKEEAA